MKIEMDVHGTWYMVATRVTAGGRKRGLFPFCTYMGILLYKGGTWYRRGDIQIFYSFHLAISFSFHRRSSAAVGAVHGALTSWLQQIFVLQ